MALCRPPPLGAGPLSTKPLLRMNALRVRRKNDNLDFTRRAFLRSHLPQSYFTFHTIAPLPGANASSWEPSGDQRRLVSPPMTLPRYVGRTSKALSLPVAQSKRLTVSKKELVAARTRPSGRQESRRASLLPTSTSTVSTNRWNATSRTPKKGAQSSWRVLHVSSLRR